MKKTPLHQILSDLDQELVDYPSLAIVILGPTASGKSALAVAVANWLADQHQCNSEIISVDSRQIYRQLNISCAKTTAKEQQGIRHHGLDLLSLHEKWTAYDFQQYAYRVITDIKKRGNLPILCGGTMLWLDAVVYNYQFDHPDIDHGSATNRFYQLGLDWPRDILYQRINQRAEKQFSQGILDEVGVLQKQTASESIQWHHNVRTSFGLQEASDFLQKKISLSQAIALNQQRNRNYAKRQLTWWRGRDDIAWLDGEEGEIFARKWLKTN